MPAAEQFSWKSRLRQSRTWGQFSQDGMSENGSPVGKWYGSWIVYQTDRGRAAIAWKSVNLSSSSAAAQPTSYNLDQDRGDRATNYFLGYALSVTYHAIACPGKLLSFSLNYKVYSNPAFSVSVPVSAGQVQVEEDPSTYSVPPPLPPGRNQDSRPSVRRALRCVSWRMEKSFWKSGAELGGEIRTRARTNS